MHKRSKRARGGLNLWSIIEAMQRRLEREGLNAEVVDAAVTRGIAEILMGGGGRSLGLAAPGKA
jgi:hypothetical protein